MKRVMIVGQPGSGKSTLARKMGDFTGLPVVHMDQIHWMPGWQPRPLEEKGRMCAEVHARDAWIFEGGHSRTWPERFARADTLIWLDFPLRVRAWRVFKRIVLNYGKTRPDSAPDCPEQFNWEFAKWIWDTRKTGREIVLRLVSTTPAEKVIVHLSTARQVADYLENLNGEIGDHRSSN